MKKNQRIAIANSLAAIDALRFAPVYEGFEHDRISIANDDLFSGSHLSQGLTDFATSYVDTSGLDEALQFVAPDVPVARRFEYRKFEDAADFEFDADDSRAVGGDFKGADNHSSVVSAKLANHGLQICVDEDEISDDPNWRERKVNQLLRRIKRNSLIRSLALLSAAATNTAKTWDTTAGKDPDGDVLADLSTGADSSGVQANRVWYGNTAWIKRLTSVRAQNNAGGYASASWTIPDLPGGLGVESVLVNRSRYGTGATKTQMAGNLVIEFMAENSVSPTDPSNIKRFFGMTEGQRYRVFEWRDGPKKYRIVVETYELVKITSTLGIRTLTIS
jgi:hypothetical protein